MKPLFNDVYRGKKVLVTGHTGFKGSWLTLWLLNLGAQIIGYSDKELDEPNMFDTLGLKEEITHLIGNINDGAKLKEIINQYQPEIVFHMAAQPLVREAYRKPVATYMTNVMGTQNLLEAIRESNSVRCFVNITTDKCYENEGKVYAFRETDPLGGYDPYSSSKACSEVLTKAYRSSYFNEEEYGVSHHVAIATVRAGNVIGGGDWSTDRLVPDCVRSLHSGETISLRYPHAIRPWQHVLEPLSGYLWVGALMYQFGPKYGGPWNFGPADHNPLNVEDVVREIIKLWGKGNYSCMSQKRFYESPTLSLDITKAVSQLGWKPVYSIKESITASMQWYRTFYKRKVNMRSYSENQINQYVQSARGEAILWTRNIIEDPSFTVIEKPAYSKEAITGKEIFVNEKHQ